MNGLYLKFLILILLVSNIYAKDKNIFLDTEFTIPLSGMAYFPDANKNETSTASPLFFLGVSLGYSLKITDNYILEPSVGYHFSSKDFIFYEGTSFSYNYYDITLPLMYEVKGFKGGVYAKYEKIPSIEISDFYGERTLLFEDKDAYSLGVKAIFQSWFISYEYLFHGNYISMDEKNKVNIEGSHFSIGLRNTF
ncbi:MAG: hypothetical protein KU29_08130 [Sulfurovum sp. FS06-10]|nr:MAG: hypothetical protein KU29_08130 [Sulfurovum sp. FS06-10]